MRAALLIAVLVVAGLASALVIRSQRRQSVVPAATEVCAARDVKPPSIVAMKGAPLFVNANDLTLRIDGDTELPAQLPPGVHRLDASAPGARSSAFSFVVRDGAPVMLDARVVERSVTVLMFGARCKTCDVAGTDINVKFNTRAVGSLGDAAAALSSGEWAKAMLSLRAVPDDERGDDFLWLHAVLLAFAGQPSGAQALLTKLPANAPTGNLMHAYSQSVVSALDDSNANTNTARWNATTERFGRLTAEFAADSPTLMTKLTERFSKLSSDFSSALTARDETTATSAVNAAESELNASIELLRQQRADCAWQQRIVGTF